MNLCFFKFEYFLFYFEIGKGIIVSELTPKKVFHQEINYAVSDKKI